MLAVKHFDPVMGVDIHIVTIPPVGPVPIPHPHISMVFDPMDYVPIMGASVLVGGVPRGTAGTAGKPVPHIPLGGPFVKPPGNEDEIFMGSATVLAEDAPFSFTALPVLGCQDIGMPAPPRAKKPRKSYGMLLPTSVVISVPAGMPVLIGGPPTIDMMGLAMAAGMAALGKAAKKLRSSKFGKKLGAKFKKAKQKAFKNMKPGTLKCKVLKAEPVNILSGEVVFEQLDFSIQGSLPLHWIRHYCSHNEKRGMCGSGWETPADIRLVIDNQGQVFFHEGGPGARVFPELPSQKNTKIVEVCDGATLEHADTDIKVKLKDGVCYRFQKTDAEHDKAGNTIYYVEKIFDTYNNFWRFSSRKSEKEITISDNLNRKVILEVRKGQIHKVFFSHPKEPDQIFLAKYRYNQTQQLTEVFDRLDLPYQYAYTDNLMTSHTDRNGASFYYEYDPGESQQTKRCVHAFGDERLLDYRFYYYNDATEYIDSLGNRGRIEFDSDKLPVKEIDNIGTRFIYQYNSRGQTCAVIDGDGARTEYNYNERGDVIEVQHPNQASIKIYYNDNGQACKLIDANDQIWTQEWNHRGRIIKQTSPSGASSTFEYDARGEISCSINPLGHRSYVELNADASNLEKYTDATGRIFLFKSDVFGNILAEKRPGGEITQYRYDKKNRLTEVINPSGACRSFAYDNDDWLITSQDENGATTHYEYSALGALTKRIHPDNTAVSYLRDTEDRLIATVNERGEKHKFQLDARGRIVKEIDYWQNEKRFSYSSGDELVQIEDELGRKILFKDLMDSNQRSVIYEDGNEDTFTYDLNGNLIHFTHQESQTTRSFDSDNRLVKETLMKKTLSDEGEELINEFWFENIFDANGNRTQRQSSAGNTVDFAFDKEDRIENVTINQSSTIFIKRNANGDIDCEMLSDSFARNTQYSPDGFITRQHLYNNLSVVMDQHYTYDAKGNLCARESSRGTRRHYLYNNVDRLVKEVDGASEAKTFRYDPAGDLLQADNLADSKILCRSATHNQSRYLFDRAGNLVNKVTPNISQEFQWDARNRLQSVHNSNGAKIDFTYDALGRRLTKAAEIRTDYFWEGDRILLEQSQELQREYIFYPETFEPLAAIDNKTSVHIFQNDINGAVMEIYSAAGDLAWSDEAVKGKANSIKNSLRLQGQYHDEETGLEYNRHRYFDVTTQSFISKDPLGVWPAANPYAYAPNVWAWMDPLGLARCRLSKADKAAMGPKPAGMTNPHRHHIVREKAPKNWDAKTRKDIHDSQAIIDKHGIDKNKSPENFTWAQNGGGNHTKDAAQKVARELRQADKIGKDAVVSKLKEMGDLMSQGLF